MISCPRGVRFFLRRIWRKCSLWLSTFGKCTRQSGIFTGRRRGPLKPKMTLCIPPRKTFYKMFSAGPSMLMVRLTSQPCLLVGFRCPVVVCPCTHALRCSLAQPLPGDLLRVHQANLFPINPHPCLRVIFRAMGCLLSRGRRSFRLICPLPGFIQPWEPPCTPGRLEVVADRKVAHPVTRPKAKPAARPAAILEAMQGIQMEAEAPTRRPPRRVIRRL